MLRVRDVEATINWEGFLAADHKWMWVLLFLSHSNSSGFKSTHNSAQILRMFPWARIPTWVSTATVVLSLSKADALLYWLDPIMVRAQYMFQQLFSSTFLGPYFCDSVNPPTNLQWTASNWCFILTALLLWTIPNSQGSIPSIFSISLEILHITLGTR